MGAPSLLSPALYMIATTLLLPGTILLLGDAGEAAYAIDFLIAACSLLTLAAIYDMYCAVAQRFNARDAAAAASKDKPSLAVGNCYHPR
jgi:cytochrome c biogenesis factor